MRKYKVKWFSIISLLVCILIFWIKPITVKASSINNYHQEQVELQAKSAIARVGKFYMQRMQIKNYQLRQCQS